MNVVIVDAAATYAFSKDRGVSISFNKLRKVFLDLGCVDFVLCATVGFGKNYETFRNTLNGAKENGWRIALRETRNATPRNAVQLAVEITCAALDEEERSTIYLLSGANELSPAVEMAIYEGCKVVLLADNCFLGRELSLVSGVERLELGDFVGKIQRNREDV